MVRKVFYFTLYLLTLVQNVKKYLQISILWPETGSVVILFNFDSITLKPFTVSPYINCFEVLILGTTIYQNYQEIPERLRNTGTAQILMFYVAVAFNGKRLMNGRTDAHTDDQMHYHPG